jgi:hypothetical protein
VRQLRMAALAVAAGTLAVLIPALPAAADGTVLTVADVGGPAVGEGDSLVSAAVSGPALMTTAGGTTGVGCDSSDLVITAGSNPAAPGTATGSVRVLSFTDCGSNIRGCGGQMAAGFLGLPYAVGIGSDGTLAVTGTEDAPIRLIVTCATPLGQVTCVFQPAAGLGATLANTDKSIVFAQVQFAKLAGPAVCPAQLFFSATYAQLQDAGQSVFLN